METRGEVEEELTSYFKGIVIEDNNDRDLDIAQITTLIPRTIAKEENEMLNKPISMQEVEEAVSQMAQGKAPSLDGFTTNFFHFFWDMIKEEVWAIMEESRNKMWGAQSLQCNLPRSYPKE